MLGGSLVCRNNCEAAWGGVQSIFSADNVKHLVYWVDCVRAQWNGGMEGGGEGERKRGGRKGGREGGRERGRGGGREGGRDGWREGGRDGWRERACTSSFTAVDTRFHPC